MDPNTKIVRSLPAASLFVVCMLFVACMVLLPSFPLYAQGYSRAVILSGNDEVDQLEILRESVSSQLSDYGVEVSVVQVEMDESSVSDSPGFGARIGEETGAGVVIWLGEGRVFVFARDKDTQNFLTRPWPTSGDSWALQCDAVASMIRAMISPWFEEPTHDSGEIEVQQDENPLHTPETVEQDIKTKKQIFFRMGAGLGYAPKIMSTSEPYLNGMQINLDFGLGEYIRLEAGVAFMQAARNGIYGFYQVPIRIELEGRLPIRKWNIGLGFSYILNMTKVSGSADNGSATDASRNYSGIGTSAVVGYCPKPWFELQFKGGIELYQESNSYYDGSGNSVFNYPPLQGRFFLGAIFWFLGNRFSR